MKRKNREKDKRKAQIRPTMVLTENKEEEVVFKGNNMTFKVSHALVLCVHAPCRVFHT